MLVWFSKMDGYSPRVPALVTARGRGRRAHHLAALILMFLRWYYVTHPYSAAVN